HFITMAEPRSKRSVVRYYCTAGNGMEAFLIDEVKTKLAAEDVCHIPGKVLFSSSANINRVSNLKAAERLFLLLKQDLPVNLSVHTSAGNSRKHKQYLVRCVSSLMCLKHLSTLLKDKLQRKTKTLIFWSSFNSVFSRLPQYEVKPTGERNKMSMTTCKDKPELLSCVPVSFRISCKCSGSLSRCLSTQEVSRVIGAGLSRLLGWKADLKNPQLEINVHLSDDYCLLGIPLTRLPLANRSYIKITGLRSTTAWAMASLAHIQPGFCVVDPMCGVGTILIEAAQEHKVRKEVLFCSSFKCRNLYKTLPLPSASVDAVICDLPFGRKFGSRIDMATNLPLILTEMERFVLLFLCDTAGLLAAGLHTFTKAQCWEPTACDPDCKAVPESCATPSQSQRVYLYSLCHIKLQQS
uniref:THUMP domain containing 2 n=1 Tax=Amphilophus citrinellus TaxID=61819 RepID=A0A3Q0RXC5_AMPCI